MSDAFLDCNFCGGKGCLACPGERAKIHKPRLLATFNTADSQDMDALREVFHIDVLEKNFRNADGSVDLELGESTTIETLRRIRPGVLE